MTPYKMLAGVILGFTCVAGCNADDPLEKNQKRTSSGKLTSSDPANMGSVKERSMQECSAWLTDKYQEHFLRAPNDKDIFVHCAKILDLYHPITYDALEAELKASPEAKTVAIIKRAYQELLGRLPEPAGRNAAYAALTSGKASEASLRESIIYSREYCGAWMRGKYQDYFGRAPNDGDYDFHCKRLVNRELTYAQFDQELQKSSEFRPRN